MPEAAWRRPLPPPEEPAAEPAEPPGIIERIFGTAEQPAADPDKVILGGDGSDTSGTSADASVADAGVSSSSF